jgi:hypothetical protein
MASDGLPPVPGPDPDRAEAAATRRRLITLAEILGVIAVLISGLTLWNAWQERTGAEADKAAERRAASAEAQTLLLRGTADREGTRLSLAAADSGQTIQTQTIAFPSPLGVAAVDTVSDPRIEAGWFDRALLRARGDADESRGDERMPIALTTAFYAGGAMHRETSIYDLGYRVEGGGLLGGHRIRLRGLSRVRQVPRAAAQARLDALFATSRASSRREH